MLLAHAHPGMNREHERRRLVGIIAPDHGAQPLFFVGRQPAHAPIALPLAAHQPHRVSVHFGIFHAQTIGEAKERLVAVHGDWRQLAVDGELPQRPADLVRGEYISGTVPEQGDQCGSFMGGPILVLHAAVPPPTLVGPVRRALDGVDPDLVLFDALTMPQIVSQLTVSQRFMSWLIGIFALLALALAAAGIYGVMSYLVTQRTREIGIRMALGADRKTVLREILGHGMKLTSAGVLLGLAGAVAGGRVLASLLFGVNGPIGTRSRQRR